MFRCSFYTFQTFRLQNSIVYFLLLCATLKSWERGPRDKAREDLKMKLLWNHQELLIASYRRCDHPSLKIQHQQKKEKKKPLKLHQIFGCKFLADPKIADKIATMVPVLLTKFHTVHTTNYAGIILDLCPYSFTTVVCLALDYSLCLKYVAIATGIGLYQDQNSESNAQYVNDSR